MCAETPPELKDVLHLSGADSFHVKIKNKICTEKNLKYINIKNIYFNLVFKSQYTCTKNMGNNDFHHYQKLNQSLTDIGFSDDIRLKIYSIVAGVLHLGNVTFDDSDDATVSCSSEKTLNIISLLIGVDSTKLRETLTFRTIRTNEGEIR